MDPADEIWKECSALPATPSELMALRSVIDLTSLEGADNPSTIQVLCQKAVRLKTAAVCVYPVFVGFAKDLLKGSGVRVASVAGAFPSGQSPLDLRLKEAEYALNEGADEIDMVISRGKFLEGDHSFLKKEVGEFRKICSGKILKVILETGELGSAENIELAGKLAIEAGADFLKTSTGKIPTGANPASVLSLLKTIQMSGTPTGIKISGGVADPNSAIGFMRLTERVLGKNWLQPSRFRIGASRLVDTL